MGNRAQRRAAARKRPGENYADVLAKQKLVKAAVDKSVHDQSVAIEADIKSQRLMWMCVVALNEAFGFGGERSKRFLMELEKVADEVEQMVRDHGGLYARTKLMERAAQITGMEIRPIHEEEMRQARLENEAKGIYFPPDDPDAW